MDFSADIDGGDEFLFYFFFLVDLFPNVEHAHVYSIIQEITVADNVGIEF